RYSHAPPARLRVLTAAAFGAAKLSTWLDRHASRDLYDLYAMAQRHLITARVRRPVHPTRSADPPSKRLGVAQSAEPRPVADRPWPPIAPRGRSRRGGCCGAASLDDRRQLTGHRPRDHSPTSAVQPRQELPGARLLRFLEHLLRW